MILHHRLFASAFIRCSLLVALCAGVSANSASALDLDWSGQFRAEGYSFSNYSLGDDNVVTDATKLQAGGYTIPGGGSSTAVFQTLFMRVRPKVIVNDNLVLKTEWWLGDPVFGFFGNASPYSSDQKQFYSNQSRGSALSAQRYWAEILTDIGTVQVGRAPLDWGLGIVWNAGDGVFDRYMSTGDLVRMVSKFGAFTFIPGYVSYSGGNSIGGACSIQTDGSCKAREGSGSAQEVSLALRYENLEEEFEAGVNFLRRLVGSDQDAASGYLGATGTPGGMNTTTYDIYARKRWGKFSLGAEVPVVTGGIGSLKYDSYAAAVEARWKASDSLELDLRAGLAPGSPSGTGEPASFEGYTFHPNYKLGLILFNAQLANFAGPSTLNNEATSAGNLRSPFDAPVSNAQYARLGGTWTTEKWTFQAQFLVAMADEVAKAGQKFYNSWERRFVDNVAGVDQGALLGWEADVGAKLRWDDAFTLGGDIGYFSPGEFYKFSNVAGDPNTLGGVFAARLQAGIQF